MELANRSKIKFLQESFVTYNVLEEFAINTKDPQKKLKFLLHTLKIRSFYIDKYGENDATTKNIVVRRVSNNIAALGFSSHDHKIAKHAFPIARENNREDLGSDLDYRIEYT